MLVTFSCKVCPNITMFGDVAIRLLNLMGHSARVPGALLADDVRPALERLQAGIEADKLSPEPEKSADREDDDPVVSLSLRAGPLIDLLETAAQANCDVMWDSNG